MTTDPEIQNQVYQCFLTEASSLLQTIEQDLLSFLEEQTIEKVHNLMRNAHTLKGSAASVERETIRTVAHHLEDVFKALYSPNIILDKELGALLWECYECLRGCVTAELTKSKQASSSKGGKTMTDSSIDETEILNQTASVLAKLQVKLGDFFGREAPLPTSDELGFDVVGSIFAENMEQELQQLAVILATQESEQVASALRSEAEFFNGLAESYNLPGMEELAQTVLTALERHPERALQIAGLALADFQQARAAVLAGDRSRGGEPSMALRKLAGLVQESDSTSQSSEILYSVSLPQPQTAPPDLKLATKISEKASETPLEEQVSEPNSKVFPKSEASADESKGEFASINETKYSFEPTQIQQNRDESDREFLPLVKQQQQDTEFSHQPTTEAAIDQILQEIGVDEQELAAGETSITSDRDRAAPRRTRTRSASKTSASKTSRDRPEQTAPTPRTTSPKRELRVDLLQLEHLNHIFGELLIDQNQQTLQTDQSQENTQEALRQLQLCQTRLNKMRNWSDKYSLLLSERQQPNSFQRQNQILPHQLQQKRASQPLASQIDSLSLTKSKQALPSEGGVPWSKSSEREGFDALEMDAYSELHVLIQSVMDAMVQLQENIEKVGLHVEQSQLTLKNQKRLLTNAQENLLQARMLPLGVLLSRFPPIVKQLVAAHHKPAELELSGTQVLIDKSISEKLFDPLLHLVRNAIAHGIESPEIRRQQGKPETGRIRIDAYHQGSLTIIEVSDDGQGLNWERLRQQAVEQQLLSAAQATMASEAELAELLFQPGFSTAEQLTELSGRGVGLDIVRTQIQGLQGSVTVRSVFGKGTVFSLHLPLILMTARSLVCQSNGLAYALLAESIERVLLPDPAQVSSQPLINEQENQKFLLWGEGQERQQVPIRPLWSLLAYSFPTNAVSANTPLAPTPGYRQKAAPLLMLRQHDQLLCLEVEEILTEQELVIKSLSRKPIVPSYIQGYSVLSDGRLTLAIDPLELVSQTWNQTPTFGQAKILPEAIATPPSRPSLLAQSQQLFLPASASPNPQSTPSNQSQLPAIADNSAISRQSSTLAIQGQSVLIVDDSATQRKLLVLTLEKAGYSVLQAGDGQEALAKLRQHSAVKLIICDIEMPRMNGFEFLYACRQDSTLSAVDVIMLTSRSNPKHRQMAFDLGAKAYLTKPCSEQDLLSLLSNLISQKMSNVSAS
jgi:chemotaxis protein histidine kinase CheA/ActR/RegA family two-component response regulator